MTFCLVTFRPHYRKPSIFFKKKFEPFLNNPYDQGLLRKDAETNQVDSC